MPEELGKPFDTELEPLANIRGCALGNRDVEAKFGLRILESKPSEMGTWGHSDPTDVEAINSLASGKGNGSSRPQGGGFKCRGAHFQRDGNVHVIPRKDNGKQASGKGKQSKSCWQRKELGR